MFRIQSVLVAIVLFSSASLLAASADDGIRQAFSKKFPQVEIAGVEPSKVKGIFQVETKNGELLYVSADSKYVLTGDLLDIAGSSTVNVSEQWRSEKRIGALNDLSDNDLVVFPAKEEKGEVLVFTDTSCGYCRKFHAEIPELNALGITVKYVAWPRYGLQSPAGQTMLNVWCADDRSGAMTLAKTNQQVEAPTGKICDQNALQNQINLGHQIGVRGTPAVFLTDGRQVGGYVKADQLAQEMGLK
jgi:thiol:disulfide interchange protein DsbC